MGGLALGSWTIGKYADQWSDKKIAIVYIFIEFSIGVYALIFPSLVGFIESLYIQIYQYLPNGLWSSIFLKSSVSMLMIVIPTFMMGGTLPLITRFLSRNWKQYTNNVSLLYGLNTFGAILGTLITGFYLLEHYGISGASKFSASINFLVAFSFFLILKFYPQISNIPKEIELINNKEKKQIKKQTKKKSKLQKDKLNEFTILLFISYGISGAASMLYQVSWTRTLSLILGTSTYAFTTMLATFLLGIAIGSMLYRLIKHNISKTKIYIYVQLFIVISVLILTIFFDELPLYYLSLVEKYFDQWNDLHNIRFVLAGLIMILPTLAMGLLFPVVCELISKHTKRVSGVVGKVYAVNSFGAMLGALSAGVFIIPSIGLQNTIYLGAFLNGFAMLIILLQTSQVTQKFKYYMSTLVIVFFIGIIAFSPRWSPKVMSSGVYTYADNYFFVSNKFQKFDEKTEKDYNFDQYNIWKTSMKNYELLYYKDGQVDTVAVMKNNDGVISLMVNGKVDASAKGEMDVATQIMIGQLPLLIHKNPKDVFLVGYASGITAGSILTHDIEILTAAEISPSVVEASKLFEKYNNNALQDPRLNLKTKDARHMLMVSNKTYDVIVSQPSNPWIKGQSSLFSYEWYEIVKEHLDDDGIFMQWLPAYSISEYNLKIILNTLNKAFPTLTLWTSSSPGDLIILASKNKALKGSYKDMIKRANQPKVQALLQRAKLNSNTLFRDLFLRSNKEIQKYLDEDGIKYEINSDDKLITEYSTPKNMVNEKLIKIFSKPKYLEGAEDSLRKIIPDIP